MKSYLKNISILIISFSLLSTIKPLPAQASTGFLPGCDLSGKSTDQHSSRPCTVDDFLVLAINLINYMLAITGSLALLFFVYGGLTLLLSAGSSEKVSKGKEILSSAVMGIVVVLTSWMIINIIYTSLVDKNSKYYNWWTTEKK